MALDDAHARRAPLQVLVVCNGQFNVPGQPVLASNVVGVVTQGDISRNVSSKSQLMARDRTLAVAPPVRQTLSNPLRQTGSTAAPNAPALPGARARATM